MSKMILQAAAVVISLYTSLLDLSGATDSIGAGCHVPPYSVSLHEVNVTAETESLLLREGRCYLSCLREGASYQVCQLPLTPWIYAMHQKKRV